MGHSVKSKSQGRRRAALALAPGLIAFSMGQTVLFAIAGPVIRDIGLTEFQLGLIVSAAAVVFVIASPIWGRISDQWGRKRVILTGLLTYSLISLAFACVMDIGLMGWMEAGAVFFTLLTLRVLYAALGTGIQPSSVALMADLSSDEDRSSAVAIVGAAFGFGMILGPAAAALLVGFGVLTPLYAIAGLGFVCLLIVLFFLDAPPAKTGDKGAKEALEYSKLLPIMAITLLLFTATSGLQQTIAFYVQDYLGADTATAARMTGICFVAMASASLVSQGILIQLFKPGPGALLKVGLPIMAVGMALYALPVNYWQIVVACGVIGLGFGFASPGVISAASLRAGSNSQGAAAGVIQALMAAGYIFGPLIGTGGYQASPMLAAGFIVISIGLSALIALMLQLEPSKDSIAKQAL